MWCSRCPRRCLVFVTPPITPGQHCGTQKERRFRILDLGGLRYLIRCRERDETEIAEMYVEPRPPQSRRDFGDVVEVGDSGMA
jgi:hypothetical protein